MAATPKGRYRVPWLGTQQKYNGGCTGSWIYDGAPWWGVFVVGTKRGLLGTLVGHIGFNRTLGNVGMRAEDLVSPWAVELWKWTIYKKQRTEGLQEVDKGGARLRQTDDT